MIEKIILNYLTATLLVPVYMEIPPKAPAAFVVLEKTGTVSKNRIQAATFAVQSYGASLLAVAELNESVKTAMDNAVDLEEICAVKLNSDYNFTDTETKRYRYQAVFDITHY